ncbi:Wadjet anti-phage system protein JetD domain-containing protein [Pseudoalteromonas sp. JB197]|uniref:Wadjet anti-phage system protein JetD domain-containing protein n=1 Tax=Pseudoalteromonas sp. JB197 TaxID=1434839 RepID=UPI00097F09FC|nr:Wadjet anti-phage system protein JetD domain-containing protein [Pseudoalteromonas sp. JB197]PCC14027.1 hypothetical protein CIK86_12610 [Pseudoalteromonas sp. JB197]SJN30461.1 hypothetical protein CZ797_06110 [Pseudoalteromonas sp. JB197]
MSLYPYLKAIKSGRTINAARFITLLKNENINFDSLGVAEFVRAERYFIHISSLELFEQLYEKHTPSRSRIHAAKQGNSHRHSTNSTYLIAKFGATAQVHIGIKCSPEKAPEEMSSFDYLTPIILIENSDCFTFCEDFLVAMELEDISHEALIIFSSGNAITHKQTQRFLSLFERIYYCPDYDLAGLEIFETLYKKLGNKIIFTMPSDLACYYEYCQKPDKQKKFINALDKAEHWKFTELSSLFSKGLGFIEQEIFLGEEYE